jgi:hypothetical protein
LALLSQVAVKQIHTLFTWKIFVATWKVFVFCAPEAKKGFVETIFAGN